jgi:hypothetical protein
MGPVVVRSRRSTHDALLLGLAALAFGACRPNIDGGWEGRARCSGNTLPLSVIVNEDKDGDLEGVIFIEGIFGGLIVKGTIDGGGYNPRTNTYDFRVQTDNDPPPELDIELELADDNVDELEGTADLLNDDGDVRDTCRVDLDRVTIDD